MTDLDVQIDVPDDDGLNNPVRVLNGSSWLPPWLKAVVILALGALAALLVGAFLVGRNRAQHDGAAPASPTAPISSATASPAVESSLAAIQAWENFAQSGNLADITPQFDESGPQYALFSAAAKSRAGTPPPAERLDFSARNLAESRTDQLTTVSMDMVVSSSQGQQTFPYDLVYRNDSAKVWTVVDRRAAGTAALPPSQAVIDAASENWKLLTSALAVGDGAGAAAVVSEPTRLLAAEVTAAASRSGTATTAANDPLGDPQLFAQLVDRARAAKVGSSGDAIVALLNADQRRALVTGQLTAWTQVDPNRVVASLLVDGQPTATVPFLATADGWAFDLVGALQSSKGGAR